MKRTLSIVSSALLVAMLTGCGGGKEDSVPVAPAPAPKQTAEVKATATTAATPPPGAPGSAQTENPGSPAGLVAAPPGDTSSTNDIFKGMTKQQIEDYKATASPETHDMNLTPLKEAIYGYYGEYRRAPKDQQDLVAARYLPRVLKAPKGKKYVIDQKTMEVSVVNE